MKTVDLTTQLATLEEVLSLADQENVVLRTKEGREYIVAELDDFDRELELVRQNEELMEFLARRSKGEPTPQELHEFRPELSEEDRAVHRSFLVSLHGLAPRQGCHLRPPEDRSAPLRGVPLVGVAEAVGEVEERIRIAVHVEQALGPQLHGQAPEVPLRGVGEQAVHRAPPPSQVSPRQVLLEAPVDEAEGRRLAGLAAEADQQPGPLIGVAEEFLGGGGRPQECPLQQGEDIAFRQARGHLPLGPADPVRLVRQSLEQGPEAGVVEEQPLQLLRRHQPLPHLLPLPVPDQELDRVLVDLGSAPALPPSWRSR